MMCGCGDVDECCMLSAIIILRIRTWRISRALVSRMTSLSPLLLMQTAAKTNINKNTQNNATCHGLSLPEQEQFRAAAEAPSATVAEAEAESDDDNAIAIAEISPCSAAAAAIA